MAADNPWFLMRVGRNQRFYCGTIYTTADIYTSVLMSTGIQQSAHIKNDHGSINFGFLYYPGCGNVTTPYYPIPLCYLSNDRLRVVNKKKNILNF